MGKGNSPNPKNGWFRGVSVTGAFKLDHLQPVKPFLFPKFSNFCTFIVGGQFLLPQRANNEKREFSQLQKMDDSEGFQCLGHSNWTICIPLNPFWSGKFPPFSLSYWEANSYYPRGPIMEKREFFQPQKWMRHRVFSALGIQTGPFASL